MRFLPRTTSPRCCTRSEWPPDATRRKKRLMLKRAAVLLRVVLLGSYAAPASAQTSTEEQLTNQFTTELNEYASTHSEQETRAYAQYRLDQMAQSYLDPQQTTLASVISPEVLYGTGEYATTSIYLDLDYDFNLSDRYRQCVKLRGQQCLDTYHADVLTASGITAGIFAGCNAITALAGFIACAAAAYVGYVLLVQAAQEKYNSCMSGVTWECKRELGTL